MKDVYYTVGGILVQHLENKRRKPTMNIKQQHDERITNLINKLANTGSRYP